MNWQDQAKADKGEMPIRFEVASDFITSRSVTYDPVVFFQFGPRIGAQALYIYGILLAHLYDAAGPKACPSQARIAELAGVSIPTVRGALKKLIWYAKLIEVDYIAKPKAGGQSYCIYRFLRPDPSILEDTPIVEPAKESAPDVKDSLPPPPPLMTTPEPAPAVDQKESFHELQLPVTVTGNSCSPVTVASKLSPVTGSQACMPSTQEKTIQVEPADKPLQQTSLIDLPPEPAKTRKPRTIKPTPHNTVWSAVAKYCFGADTYNGRVVAVVNGAKRSNDPGLIEMHFGAEHDLTQAEADRLVILIRDGSKWYHEKQGMSAPRLPETIQGMLHEYMQSHEYKLKQEAAEWEAKYGKQQA